MPVYSWLRSFIFSLLLHLCKNFCFRFQVEEKTIPRANTESCWKLSARMICCQTISVSPEFFLLTDQRTPSQLQNIICFVPTMFFFFFFLFPHIFCKRCDSFFSFCSEVGQIFFSKAWNISRGWKFQTALLKTPWQQPGNSSVNKRNQRSCYASLHPGSPVSSARHQRER